MLTDASIYRRSRCAAIFHTIRVSRRQVENLGFTIPRCFQTSLFSGYFLEKFRASGCTGHNEFCIEEWLKFIFLIFEEGLAGQRWVLGHFYYLGNKYIAKI